VKEGILGGTLHFTFQEEWPQLFKTLVESCLHPNQESRPSLDAIIGQLTYILHSFSNPQDKSAELPPTG